MARPTLKPSDVRRAVIAKKAGANYVWRIIFEARRAGIKPSLGFALVEQESNFSNVFGHDPTIFIGAGQVTKEKYLRYKQARGHTRMQGVGPVQLTWWEFQDRADRLGGCWKPQHNIRVGFSLLADLVKVHGERKGLAIYNGGSVRPNFVYADQVLARRKKWHDRFN